MARGRMRSHTESSVGDSRCLFVHHGGGQRWKTSVHRTRKACRARGRRPIGYASPGLNGDTIFPRRETYVDSRAIEKRWGEREASSRSGCIICPPTGRRGPSNTGGVFLHEQDHKVVVPGVLAPATGNLR